MVLYIKLLVSTFQETLQGDYKKCDETFFFLILRAINAIEILKNRVLLFVLKRHFTTSQER